MECSGCKCPTPDSKYYCSNSSCQVILCRICLKSHPKEHISTVDTIENLKSQTFRIFQEETQNQFQSILSSILRSTELNEFFKDAFGTLIQQNTTVNLDHEDIADIIADKLKRQYFPKGIKVEEPPKKDSSIDSEKQEIIWFGFEYDAESLMEDENEDREDIAKELCSGSSKFYSAQQVGALYIKPTNQIIFWDLGHEDLLYMQKDLNLWCKFPESLKALRSFTVLYSKELFILVALEEDLIIYTIKEEEGGKGAFSKVEEFKHEKIVFLWSDTTDHIFVVTESLTASIYILKNQDNKLELCRLASFEVSDIPNKVTFDAVNKLLFISYSEILHVYKCGLPKIPQLIQKFTHENMKFSWHQETKRLLLLNSSQLYQFDKGKFRLLRTIEYSITCLVLTKKAIIGKIEDEGFYLFSLKNPQKKKLLKVPSGEDYIGSLQDKCWNIITRFGYNGDVEPSEGSFDTLYGGIVLLNELPDTLLLLADISYSQSASQQVEYGRWKQYGGSIFTQHLMNYDLTKTINIEKKMKSN